MPRPVELHPVPVNVVPEPQSQAPQLGVFASLQGVQAPQTSGFAGLAQALQEFGPPLTNALQQRDAATTRADTAAGQADAELEQVDPERAARSRAYADAAHDTNIIRQYHEAEAATLSWAATGLDASKPYTEQTAQLDARMKQELGGLAKDPRAKVLIGERYQKFIEGAAGQILGRQNEARQNEAIDTVQRDVAADLANGGDGRYSEQVQRLTPLLGDRTKAVQRVVGMYIDHAVDIAGQGGDWRRVFKALPSDITLPDGTKIPGPGRSPALHDAIARGMDAAQRAYNGYMEPQRAAQQLHTMTQLDNIARHGGLITEESLKPYITPGPDGQAPILSAAQAAGYMDRARNRAEQLAAEAATRRTLQLSPNWMRLVGQKDPSDPKGNRVFTKEAFQLAYDQTLGMATQGFSAPDTVQQAISLTRENPGLISTNLKLQLAAAAASTDPAAAWKLLPVFRALQDAKQDGLYLAPKDRTYFMDLAAKEQAGVPDAKNQAAVMNTAAAYDPQRVARLTRPENMTAARSLVTKRVGGSWFLNWGATKLDDFANVGQVRQDVDSRLRDALIRTNGNAPQAAAIVNAQVENDYVPVTVQGQHILLPNRDGSDPARVQARVSALADDLLPELAKRAGLTKEQASEQLGFQVYTDHAGTPMLEIVDDTGQAIDSIPPIPLDKAMMMGEELRERHADTHRRDAATNTRAIEKARTQQQAGMFSAGRMR